MDGPSSQETGRSPSMIDEASAKSSCERCGATNAERIGAHCLCPNCYSEAGSCCLEFGADDLWDLEETKPL